MRAILSFAAILASAALLVAGRPTGAETRASVAGQFLVASPSMADPRFDRAVILMMRHGADGALGIVINKPLGERPLPISWRYSARRAATPPDRSASSPAARFSGNWVSSSTRPITVARARLTSTDA